MAKIGHKKDDDWSGDVGVKKLLEKGTPFLTLDEINAVLAYRAEMLEFEMSLCSERTRKNCEYIVAWCKMGADEFRRRSKAKNIFISSGAYVETESTVALRMPVNDSGKYIMPLLGTVIDLLLEREMRIHYAEEKRLHGLDQLARDKSIRETMLVD